MPYVTRLGAARSGNFAASPARPARPATLALQSGNGRLLPAVPSDIRIALVRPVQFGWSILTTLGDLGFPVTVVSRRPDDTTFLKRYGAHPRYFEHVVFRPPGHTFEELPEERVPA